MARGYTLVDERDSDSDSSPSPRIQMRKQIRQEMIEKLVTEWNHLDRKIERRSYLEDDQTEEYEYHSEQVTEIGLEAYHQAIQAGKSKEEASQAKEDAKNQYWDRLNLEENKDSMRMEVIEELLSELGARMMRPYEHWNEEERYMEYMENRYSNEGY
jgi:hypothetical protein